MPDEAPPQIPQETPPPKLIGELVFSCCGQSHTIKGEIEQAVCPICDTAYGITLYAKIPVHAKWKLGTKVRVVKEIISKLGCKTVKFEIGEELTVGEDLFGALGTLEETTLVQVESPSADGKKRILLAPIPNDALEIVSESQ